MHGTFGSQTATKTPAKSLDKNTPGSSHSAPTVGRSTGPGIDPRTKQYVEA